MSSAQVCRWCATAGSVTMRDMGHINDAEMRAVDVAIVAYRDEDAWNVAKLPVHALESVATIAAELRRYPGEYGALGMLSVDEDFVVLVRVQGALVRVLLSDSTAAGDWKLARSAIEHLGVHLDDDDEEQTPVGDLGIVADLGFAAGQMAVLLDDFDLYPDEVLSEISDAVGFGERFDELAGIDGS